MTEIEVMNKKQQRKLAVDRRRALTQDERDEKSRVICDILTRLIKEPRYSEVRTIFSYRGTWDYFLLQGDLGGSECRCLQQLG